MSVSLFILDFGSCKWTFNPNLDNCSSIFSFLSICLGIITVKRFLYFFFNLLWISPANFSSELWVLEAHHAVLFEINFIVWLSISIFSFSDWEYFKLPKYFIFFAPSFFKKLTVSLFADKQRSNLLKINLEKLFTLIHLL